jgi:ecotin
MRKDLVTGLAAAALLLASPVSDARSGRDPLDAYPPAPAGQQRYVIRLAAQSDEPRFQVELLIGKTMEVDCNRHSFMGIVEQQVVTGWGYPYWSVRDVRGAASTMMACPGEKQTPAFVTVGGGPHWARYNSKLPVVVYVPQGFEVRFRLWTAGETAQAAVE